MKINIILKLKKSNQYSKYNGLTFEPEQIFKKFISIRGVNDEYPENLTDFYFGEFLICNIQKLVEFYRNNYDYKINCLLVNYCISNKINIDFAKGTNFYDQVKEGIYF